MCQRNGSGAATRASALSSQAGMACSIRRKCENGGREQSSLRNQRRSVEGSATRLASNRVGAEDSQEQCSVK